jgi:serine/threonine protein kinase
MKVPPKSLPKWLNDIILGELRPLFLRVRFLDEKNEILEDFISKMFPKFFESNQQRAMELAKHYRSTWSDWRHTLQKNIKERYTRKNSLEHRHVNEIFQQWLTAIRGNPSNEITNALRNVVVEEFKSVDQNLKPLNQSKSDRFTIDLSLNSRSGYDIAASLNLAYDEAASSSEEDQQIFHKKRGGSRAI